MLCQGKSSLPQKQTGSRMLRQLQIWEGGYSFGEVGLRRCRCRLGRVGGAFQLAGRNVGLGLAQCSLWETRGLRGKGPVCQAGDAGYSGLIPESGRSPGEGNGNPVQYSCLENPMDRRAWWAAVHGVAKCHTELKRLSSDTHSIVCILQGMRKPLWLEQRLVNV